MNVTIREFKEDLVETVARHGVDARDQAGVAIVSEGVRRGAEGEGEGELVHLLS